MDLWKKLRNMNEEIVSELRCDKCRKQTPVRISYSDGMRLCKECRDTFEYHDLSVANEDTEGGEK